MRTFGEAATKYGVPVPKYEFDGLYLNLTIYRHAQAALQALGAAVLAKLTAEERKGWTYLSGRTEINQSEYASNLGVTARTAQRHLRHFVELGLLRRTGSGPATKYLKL
jgi:predicted HTH transcriptional regulator